MSLISRLVVVVESQESVNTHAYACLQACYNLYLYFRWLCNTSFSILFMFQTVGDAIFLYYSFYMILYEGYHMLWWPTVGLDLIL